MFFGLNAMPDHFWAAFLGMLDGTNHSKYFEYIIVGGEYMSDTWPKILAVVTRLVWAGLPLNTCNLQLLVLIIVL